MTNTLKQERQELNHILVWSNPAATYRHRESDSAVWPCHLNGNLGAPRQIQIIPPLNVHRTGSSAGSHDGSNCCPFTAPGNRTDDCSHGRSNRSSLYRLSGLTVFLDGSFVINRCAIAVRSANALKNSREAIRLTVSQAYPVEIKGHL